MPSIVPELINDSTPVKDIIRKYGTQTEYVQTTATNTAMFYTRRTAAGKEVSMPPG